MATPDPKDSISVIPNWQIAVFVIAWTLTSAVIGAAIAAAFCP